MLARAKMLKAKLPGASQDVHFNQLSTRTVIDIDNSINALYVLLNNDIDNLTEFDLNEKVKHLKSTIATLDRIENWPVAALSRQSKDDTFLNYLINRICNEINYPLIPPVASCFSQSYYYIIPHYNLICVPLLEADFLLHTADVYHELAHAIIATADNPKVEQYRLRLGGFISHVREHFEKTLISENRKSKNLGGLIELIDNWRYCWVKSWIEEFYCDLFGVYCIGPAYAWAHMHLCLKRGGDPYEIPYYSIIEHPPDNARMDIILLALELLNFNEAKQKISQKWNNYLGICGFDPQPEYFKALPTELLEFCVTSSFEALKVIDVTAANQCQESNFSLLLNEAWQKFHNNPDGYIKWEKEQLQSLKNNYQSSVQ